MGLSSALEKLRCVVAGMFAGLCADRADVIISSVAVVFMSIYPCSSPVELGQGYGISVLVTLHLFIR